MDTHTFVVECDTCQQHKGEKVNPLKVLQHLLILTTMWVGISMDFITGLPKSDNISMIMVVVDKLFEYAHLCVLPHPFKDSIVAQLFMENTFKLHGMLKSIVTNCDPTFTDDFWQELFWLQGTHLNLNTAYFPKLMSK